MDRRVFLGGGLALGGLSAAFLSGCGPKADTAAGPKVLRIIHPSNLASLDPVWTTAAATKDYAFLTFDNLVALDADYVPQPQMAEGWTVEDDGKAYVFTLREGLKWHDGAPVRPQDCIASIQRWAIRDSFGQIMMTAVESMTPVDDRTFRIQLTKPFPLLPNALGKTAGPQCFMMPERMAKVPATEQITEWVGSGPYKFLKDEWISGAKAAWAKNDDYVPRKEPPSGIAGGRVPAVDRIEWTVITDSSTAMAALLAGEQDGWDFPPAELVEKMKDDPHLQVQSRNKAGGYFMLQFNHLQAPFNSQAVRQAVAMAVDQEDFIKAVQSDPELGSTHYGIYTNGTQYATEAGADILKVRSIDKGKAALAAAGYKGEKVVLLANQESAQLASLNFVAEDLLRKLGMNVELVAMDAATLASRRLNREGLDKGGWSLYLTGWTGNDVLNPAVNPMLRGSGLTGFPGWCDDPELERLRAAWAFSADPEEQKRMATAVQVRALQTLPYIPLGSTMTRSVYRDTVKGLFPCPVSAYWGLSKA